VAEAVDALGKVAIGPALLLIDIGELAGAAGIKIAFKKVGGEIEVARDRRRRGGLARLARARLDEIPRGVSSWLLVPLPTACPLTPIMPMAKPVAIR